MKTHLETKHVNSDPLNCRCKFTSAEDNVLKCHEKGCHIVMKENEIKETESIEEVANDSAIICGECNTVFQSIIECEEHLKTHPSQCYKCDFKSENSEELNSH